MAGTAAFMFSLKLYMCPERIEQNMWFIVSSDGNIMQYTENIEINLGSTSFLPPPDLPIAAYKTKNIRLSIIVFKT